MEGIKVPVSLEIVQSSITAVKNAIANLKPNSKNWETLQGILRTMEREADRLAVTMSKPFTSEAQFTQAEKSIDKIDEALGLLDSVEAIYDEGEGLNITKRFK